MRERWSVSPAKKYHTACEILRETSYLGLHLFTVCVLLQWFYKPPIPQPTHKKLKLWWFSSRSLLKRQPLNEEESVCVGGGGGGGAGCVRACVRARVHFLVEYQLSTHRLSEFYSELFVRHYEPTTKPTCLYTVELMARNVFWSVW